MNTLIVLGSNGFIGKEICSEFSSFEVVSFNRQSNEILGKFNPRNKTVVINSMASSVSASIDESLESNFSLPFMILSELASRVEDFRWIQLASYYEYQIPHGRRDYYSYHKRQFREDLNQSVFKDKVINLVLPHVSGPGERKTRILSTISNCKAPDRIQLDTDGSQFIPILHVKDVLRAIDASFQQNSGTYFLKPTINVTLVKLVEYLKEEKILNCEIEFDQKMKATDADYPMIDFEPVLPGWIASLGIKDIIRDIRLGKD
jgi:nucleoside-diphosphate-sugar epimerase